MAAALAVLVMVLFAGGLWFAYMQGARHSGATDQEVPLIRADERPTRVKPAQPGGMEVPDRDKLIYTQKRAAVEHLLPQPEKPMPRPTPPALPPGDTPPDGPITVPGAPTATVGPANQPQQQAAAPPSAAPLATTKPAAAPATAYTGGTRLQLGSLHSENEARQEWDRIKRKNPDLLGNLSATPVRIDLGEKGTFYRLQAGPVSDRATAERLCGELKQRNFGCMIVR